MSRSYQVRAGDTYSTIARRVYGDDQKSFLIRNGNPGSSEPLQPGVSIIIPDDPAGMPSGSANAAASEPNEISLVVSGVRFRFWTAVTINMAIDTQSIVEFTAPFEPDDQNHREMFRPFSFKGVTVDVAGIRLFTGTMVAPTPSLTTDSRTVSVSCYSKPGVLGDCTAPASSYPLEWSGATLRVIAEKVAGLFGIGVVFDGDPGGPFKKVALEPGTKALDFLSDLASQRLFTIGSTADGKLKFSREPATPSQPVASLSQGVAPLISVTPQFSPQDYYSHVTGIAPVVIGSAGTKFTVKNARLAEVLRPFTFDANDSKDNDVKQTTETKAGRMIANAAAYDLELATMRDQYGNLWMPGTYISLLAEGAMVYSRYTFLIRSVKLEKTQNSEKATLTVIIPGSLSGVMPGVMPWDE